MKMVSGDAWPQLNKMIGASPFDPLLTLEQA